MTAPSQCERHRHTTQSQYRSFWKGQGVASREALSQEWAGGAENEAQLHCARNLETVDQNQNQIWPDGQEGLTQFEAFSPCCAQGLLSSCLTNTTVKQDCAEAVSSLHVNGRLFFKVFSVSTFSIFPSVGFYRSAHLSPADPSGCRGAVTSSGPNADRNDFPLLESLCLGAILF
ncbi:hypothetical protein SKAU_G00297410 [Synaphobranchus kaupii]|uniref:Uncharacterized protein n=1 Tax=Synaphobranchus kaupii TaxID=118154 RepID=A0A9Q1EV36_SYNKA|nr:hypothetical protein SKAU_G00297410 [Synaphobranchus kaupii]